MGFANNVEAQQRITRINFAFYQVFTASQHMLADDGVVVLLLSLKISESLRSVVMVCRTVVAECKVTDVFCILKMCILFI